MPHFTATAIGRRAPVTGSGRVIKIGNGRIRGPLLAPDTTTKPIVVLGPWSLPKNFVDQTPDGAPAVLPAAVALGDCIFALVTQSQLGATCGDNVNGAFRPLGVPTLTGDNSRVGYLWCFLASKAAAAGTLSISAPGGDGQSNIVAWVQTPPTGWTTLEIGPTPSAGGVGASLAAGPMTTTKRALIVAGARMRPNSGDGPMNAGAGFTWVGGAGAGYLQAEYETTRNAAPGNYNATFTAQGALDGWVALSGAIYASP